MREVYYTNSTNLPVNFTDDPFLAIGLQDSLLALYTGGSVHHTYLGERISPQGAKAFIKKVFSMNRLPYMSITPSFSICQEHGYLKGEAALCPHCGGDCEIWSRVTGYLRPIGNYNPGKKQEFDDRKKYNLDTKKQSRLPTLFFLARLFLYIVLFLYTPVLD